MAYLELPMRGGCCQNMMDEAALGKVVRNFAAVDYCVALLIVRRRFPFHKEAAVAAQWRWGGNADHDAGPASSCPTKGACEPPR